MTYLRKISFWVYNELIRISISLLLSKLIPRDLSCELKGLWGFLLTGYAVHEEQ